MVVVYVVNPQQIIIFDDGAVKNLRKSFQLLSRVPDDASLSMMPRRVDILLRVM